MDEAGLIAAARLGDEDAFAKLYRQHVGYVRGIGKSILRTSDLDDLCQDTFLLAFTRLTTFDDNCPFRPWIARIAVNRCYAILRRRRQGKNGDALLLHLDEEKAGADFFEHCVFACEDIHLESTPTRLDLARVLEVLTPHQRRVLTMAYLEGVPDREIAEILGTTLASVISTLHHAKRRVRNKYANGWKLSG
jgi:RNA polymerase sigma factor (sigma-70 family)